MDPVDPGNVPHGDFDSDSDVNPDRYTHIDALVASRVQAAMADVGRRYDAYQWDLDGQMLVQDQRMASLEFQQSKLNAGEFPVSGL